MEFIYSIVGFFVGGGPFMYPIMIVFAVGAAIAFERAYELKPSYRRRILIRFHT